MDKVVAGDGHVTAVVWVLRVHIKVSGAHAVLVSCLC